MLEEFNNSYRSQFQIIRDILLVVDESKSFNLKKTHIMYGANLSYKLLKRYLNQVLKAKLICKDNMCYKITDKGKKYLQFYNDYEEKFMEINESINNLNNGKKILKKMLEQ